MPKAGSGLELLGCGGCLSQVFSMGDIKPNKVADPEARAALVWILGQFGKHLESKSGIGAFAT